MNSIEETKKIISGIVPKYDSYDNNSDYVEAYIKDYLTDTINIIDKANNNNQFGGQDKEKYIINNVRELVNSEIWEGNSGGAFYGGSREKALKKFLEYINDIFHFDDDKGMSIYLEEYAKYEEEKKNYYPYKK